MTKILSLSIILFILAAVSIVITRRIRDTKKRNRIATISEIFVSLFLITVLVGAFLVIMSLQDFNIVPGVQENNGEEIYTPLPAISIGFLSWGELNIKYSNEYSNAYTKMNMWILEESHNTLRIGFDIYLYTSNRSYLLEKAPINKLVIALPIKIEDPNTSFICYPIGGGIGRAIKPEQFFEDYSPYTPYTTYYMTYYNRKLPITFYKLYILNLENTKCSHISFSTKVSKNDNPEFFSVTYLSKRITFTLQPVPNEIKELLNSKEGYVSIWKYHDLITKNKSNIFVYVDPNFKAKVTSKIIPITQGYNYDIENSQIYPTKTIQAIVISFYYKDAPKLATLLTILLIYFVVWSAKSISIFPRKIAKLSQTNDQTVSIFDIILFTVFVIVLIYTILRY